LGTICRQHRQRQNVAKLNKLYQYRHKRKKKNNAIAQAATKEALQQPTGLSPRYGYMPDQKQHLPSGN